MIRTNIIVTCWNALDYTKVTLRRLFETVHQGFYLTIIDNGSSDGTGEYLKGLVPSPFCKKLTIITNRENCGPCMAVNQGYKVSKVQGVEFSCLCNNDLFFQTGWLERLESAMIDDKMIGILGPLRPAAGVKHFKGISTVAVQKSTPLEDCWRNELEFFIDESFDNFDIAAEKIIDINGGGIDILEVLPEAISSCCVIVRNAAVDCDGWIADPRYTSYGAEDMDMTWTIASRGYKCAILKEVYVHHFRNKSIKASGLDRQRCILEGNRIFFDKWKHEIYHFLLVKQTEGADLGGLLNIETDNGYWFLHRLNRDIKFWSGSAINEERFEKHNEQSKSNI